MNKKILHVIACSLICLLGEGGFNGGAQGRGDCDCLSDEKSCIYDCGQDQSCRTGCVAEWKTCLINCCDGHCEVLKNNCIDDCGFSQSCQAGCVSLAKACSASCNANLTSKNKK